MDTVSQPDCVYAFGNAVSLLTTGTAEPFLGRRTARLPHKRRRSLPLLGVALLQNWFLPMDTVPPATGGGFGSGWPNAFPTDQYSTTPTS
jgi:hypothetical protein